MLVVRWPQGVAVSRIVLCLGLLVSPIGLLGCGARTVPVVEAPQIEPPPKRSSFTRRKGTIDSMSVEKVMKTSLPEYNRCYGDLLSRMPETALELVLGFTIDTDGRARQGRIMEPADLELPMSHCVLDVLAEMRFPQPSGGHVEVSYPLKFSPE